MTNDKQTSKHKLGNRTNRWSKVQADARCPNSKKQLKADFQSVLRTLESLFTTFVLFHVRRHKM